MSLVPVISSETSVVHASEPYPILQAENGQIVLYNPSNHALSIADHRSTLARTPRRCPYCARSYDDRDSDDEGSASDAEDEHAFTNGAHIDSHFDGVSTAANYFQLLDAAHETASRPATPPAARNHLAAPSAGGSREGGRRSREPSPTKAFRRETMAEGYFAAFFVEEARLGMGANGSVYLCQHVLNGNALGRFAVKKIAIGESQAYLLQILREVRLLESLRHPHIVTYHHAWLESTRFSSFGPAVPTLHVLMQWAEGGSLEGYIEIRLGRTSHPAPAPQSSTSAPEAEDVGTRAGRIRAFRAMQRAPPAEKERLRAQLGLDIGASVGDKPGSTAHWRAVHLFSAEEVKGIFGGIVDGLAYLHEKSILHLDLKPGNVLLTWDAAQPLMPRALLSDFGTSRDALRPADGAAPRTGNTGTLDYTAPEGVPPAPSFATPTSAGWAPPPADSKADMWSLGMVLHKILFFRLPYAHASGASAAQQPLSERSSMDALAAEIRGYRGFRAAELGRAGAGGSKSERVLEARRLPGAWGVLLEGLLAVDAARRPSAERVLAAVRGGQLDPLPRRAARAGKQDALIPASLAPVEPQLNATALRPGVVSHVSEVALDEMATPPASPATPTQALSHSSTPRAEKTDPLASRGPQRAVQRRPPPARAWVGVVKRTTKAGILAAKVVSLYAGGTGLRPATLTLLLALAIMDNVYDGLAVTAVCTAVHVGLLVVCAWTGVC